MEIQLNVLAREDMTEREIAALSRNLFVEFDRLRDAENIRPVAAVKPDAAKGFGQAIGSFLMSIPAEAITGVLGILQAFASRPGQPPFTMKISRDAVEVSFDPRRMTPDQIAALADRLRPPS